MLLKYDVEESWSNSIKIDENNYIVGLFIANSNNLIKVKEDSEEKSFEKSLIKVLQDLSPGITLMMRPFRLFPFYYPYTVRLYRKHARSEVLIIPRDDSLYIPCH